MLKRQNGSTIWAVARTSFAVFILSGALLAPAPLLAQQLPTGGTVTNGSASIGTPQGGTLNINQTSNRAIIDWNSFSVGAGGRVNFNQPGASAATLNRVTGTTSSTIAGAITAPGTVLLVNPNGIAITPTGTVNVGSFAASTLNIKNEDFLAGNYKFTGNGSSASVTNAGRINVSDGGFAALLGGRVANDGIITARLGRVGLGSGEKITLDLSGDGFLQVEVPSNQLGNIVDGTGQALVSNRGKIRADGGIVHLSAATASTILRDAVNVPGSIRANSVGTRGGRIVLGGGAGGRVTVSGHISASGTRVARRHQPAAGGRIDITGAEIALAGARLNASGATGGGRIRIGGDYQGSGDLPHAQRVSIDSASVIRADATQVGNGGTIIVWSDGLTSVSGVFSARGGANGGNGGLVETSGHELSFNGVRVDTSAGRGRTGEWLLDPENLTVDAAAAATINANLANSGVTLLTTSTTATGPGIHSAGAGDIIINAPLYWTSGNQLSLNAYNSIYINATIVGQGTGSTLWLRTGASGVVAQTAPISVQNLILPINFSSITLNNTGNVVGYLWTDTSTLDPNGDTFNANPGSLAFTNNGSLITGLIYANNLTLNVGGSLTGTSVINGATNSRSTVTSIVVSGDITFTSGALGGADMSVTAGGSIALGSITVGGALSLRANGNISFSENVTAFFDRSITSTSIRSDNGLVTFASGRQIFTSNAVEIFYNPYVATGSYANVSSYAGLTSGVGNGSVTAYMLVNNLTQLDNVRQNLAGTYALGNDIDASSTMCSCAGFRPFGTGNTNFTGLFDGRGHVIINMGQDRNGAYNGEIGSVGLFYVNAGTIRNVGMLGGRFNGGPNSPAGALVATNNGTISNSFSTATVISNGSAYFNMVGGLVGWNTSTGTINGGSYATGSVTGYNIAGGLVGENDGVIADSYSAGSVTGSTAGGLVGLNRLNGSISYTYSLASVTGSGWTGGLVGMNYWGTEGTYGRISNSYAAGRLSGTSVGGLVGNNDFNFNNTADTFNQQINQSARVVNSYWDATATGTGRAFGRSYNDLPGGWSSEQVQHIGPVADPFARSSYSDFNSPAYGTNFQTESFDAHWYIVDGATRPMLRAEFSTNIQNLHQLQLVDMNATATYQLARNIDASTELASGMWRNNSFAPIAPLSYNPYQVQEFSRYQLGLTQVSVQESWSGNVLLRYISYPSVATTGYTQTAQYYQYTTSGGDFSGTLNGNGHTISNLYVGGGYKSAGLFDTIGVGGRVQDLGIVNSQFVATTGNAGSIAGINNGTIERSYAIRGSGAFENVVSDGAAGGLVGLNNGTISQSYASVYVYGIGQSTDDWQFYAQLGGLVGTNTGNIVNAYATSRVSGNGYLGGLVGRNFGNITNTYAASTFVRAYSGYGVRVAGRLVGADNGTTTNSYYNSDLALPDIVSYIGTAGTPLTTAQMQDFNTFATIYQGWDFRGVWVPPNQVGQLGETVARYPEFYWANHVAVVDPAEVSRSYGDANPQLLVSVYGLRSYDTPAAVPTTVTTSATASSNVGTYAITTSRTVLPALATMSGPTGGSQFGPAFYGLNLNGRYIYFARDATLQQVIDAFNAETGNTGVTAAISATGGLSLTSASTFTIVGLSVSVGNGAAFLGLPSDFARVFTYSPRQQQAVSSDGTAYRVINLPGALTITPRAVDVTANGGSSTYGDPTQANPGLTVTGLINGDTISGLSNSFNITNTTNAGTYTLTVNGTVSAGSNYTVTTHNGTWTVNRANLTVTANGGSSTYGDPTQSNPGLTVSGLRNNDTLSGLSNSFNITNTTGAGAYTLNVNGTFNNANYNLSRQSGTWTVNQAELTVTANGGSSTYGDPTQANPGLQVTGLRNNDTISGLSNSFNITNTTNAGSYTLSVNGAFNNPNYHVTTQTGSWTVNPADVVVTANGGSSTYGQSPTNPGLSATGLRNGQGVSALTGLFNSFDITNLSGANTYTLNVNGVLTNPNYRVVTRNDGVWTVNPADIIVAAVGGTSIYGQSPANPGLSATGLQNGEGVGVLTGLTNSFGITSTTGAGSHVLMVNGTLANPNYRVTTRNDGNWTVTPANVVVTALGGTSIYGQSPLNPGLSATGLQNGENVSVLTGLTNSFGITNLTGAGGHVVNVNGVLSNPNYNVTTRNSGLWTVNPADVVVTALGGTSIYGQSPLNPGLSATGLQNGEDVSVLTGLTNSFGITNLTGAGNHVLNVNGALTNPNYNITTRNDGVWTVSPATITVTALGGTSIYGQSPTNPGLSATGLQNGEGVGVLTGLTNSFGITNLTGAGNHVLNVNGVLTNPNYTVKTTNDGVWVVTPADIIVAAVGGISIYGQSPLNPGLSATGLQNGEDVSVLTGLTNSFGITNLTGAGNHVLNVNGTLTNGNYNVTTRNSSIWTVNPAAITVTALGGRSTYGQSPLNRGISATGLQNGEGVSVLTGLTNTFGITNLSGAATYTLSVAGTLTNGNYTITTRNQGVWAVDPAHITVTANGGRSTYGQSPTDPGFSATGLQNGETVAVLGGLGNSFGINGRTNAGSSTLRVAGALTNTNYVIDNRVAGLWTVDRAALTVAADPQSRLFSEADPLLTYRITSGQLFNGDGFAGVLSRDSGDAPGFYAITQGTLAASSNYALTFVGATLEIRALPSGGPSLFPANAPTAPGNPTTVSFQPPQPGPVTIGTPRSSVPAAPTTTASVTPVDPVVTAALNPNERALNYLPISQFEAREYSTGALPGYEDRTGEATVLTMIARAIAGERTNTLFIDNFWSTQANNNAGETEFDLIAQRVMFSDGQGKKIDPEKADPFGLQNNDPAKLLQSGPLMIVSTAPNGQSWMLALRLTEDGKGIVANDPSTGQQVILAYNPQTHDIGGVTSVRDPKSNTFIPIDNADALKAAGLDQFTPERVAALQAFAPTGYLAVGVN